ALRSNARELETARRELVGAQRTLAARVVDLYTSDGGDSTLEIVLGAKSLGEMLDELDAAQRIAAQDVLVLRQVKTYRARVAHHRAELVRARSEQRRLVGRLAGERTTIQGRIAERQRLLGSIQGEIVRLKAEERARQAQL